MNVDNSESASKDEITVRPHTGHILGADGASATGCCDSTALAGSRLLSVDDGTIPPHLRRVLQAFPDHRFVRTENGPRWQVRNPIAPGGFCFIRLFEGTGEPEYARVEFEFAPDAEDKYKARSYERQLRDERLSRDQRRDIRKKQSEFRENLRETHEEWTDDILRAVGLKRSDLRPDIDKGLRLPDQLPERLEYVLRRLPFAVSEHGATRVWSAPCPLHLDDPDDLSLTVKLHRDGEVGVRCGSRSARKTTSGRPSTRRRPVRSGTTPRRRACGRSR
jgi:hypothetical protein